MFRSKTGAAGGKGVKLPKMPVLQEHQFFNSKRIAGEIPRSMIFRTLFPLALSETDLCLPLSSYPSPLFLPLSIPQSFLSA